MTLHWTIISNELTICCYGVRYGKCEWGDILHCCWWLGACALKDVIFFNCFYLICIFIEIIWTEARRRLRWWNRANTSKSRSSWRNRRWSWGSMY